MHAVNQVYPLLLINALRSQIAKSPSSLPPPRLLLPLPNSSARTGTPRPPAIKATFDMAKTKPSLTSALPLPVNDQYYRDQYAPHRIDGVLIKHQNLKNVDSTRLELWLPVDLLELAFPAEVAVWKASSGKGKAKLKESEPAKKVGKGKGRGRRDASTSDVDEPQPKRSISAPKRPKSKPEPKVGSSDAIVIGDSDDEEDTARGRRAGPTFVDDSDDDDNLLPNTLLYSKRLPPPPTALKPTTITSNPLRPIQSQTETITIDASPPKKKARREPAKVGGGTAGRIVIEID